MKPDSRSIMLVSIVGGAVGAVDAGRLRHLERQVAATEEAWPQRFPTKKEAADTGASEAAARKLPWMPTHQTWCGQRPCRPGEGNLAGYKMWGQPYIHREAWVQAKSRRTPHSPEPPQAHYAGLLSVARRVQHLGLVIMAAGDFDFRLIVLNWYRSCERQGYKNALVLSMDSELHAELTERRIPTFDNSANVNEWNATCLQRHIQRVRMERHIAVAALVAGGLDVLLTDATVIFVKDALAFLRAPPLDGVDLAVQRECGPSGAAKRIGTAVNAGFTLVRARKQEAVQRFLRDMVRRGLVEFYNRWNNVVDQMGWSFLVADTADLHSPTSVLANESTITTLRRYELSLAFLPYNRFPRVVRPTPQTCSVDMQQCGHAAVWTRSSVDMQQCGHAAVWTCSSVNVQQCGRAV